ncbi:PAAR domain protein [Pseudomonas syringae pv. viburni]|uniref:PAAR domain protein n=1 Tax=Pseudomonas syringae pv. viburni TaxID=251703 RepID=A0A0Q0CTQ5_9PSED|nr:PAAR domain protein [Pseudomonas syringae pv. viburni]
MAHLGSPTSHGGMLVTGSQDVGGGFTFGGAAASRVIDFSRLGILQPDGTLDEQRLEALLADPQLAVKADAAGAVVDTSGVSAPPRPTRLESPLCNHPDRMNELASY